jgi:hypothetical protein
MCIALFKDFVAFFLKPQEISQNALIALQNFACACSFQSQRQKEDE